MTTVTSRNVFLSVVQYMYVVPPRHHHAAMLPPPSTDKDDLGNSGTAGQPAGISRQFQSRSHRPQPCPSTCRVAPEPVPAEAIHTTYHRPKSIRVLRHGARTLVGGEAEFRAGRGCAGSLRWVGTHGVRRGVRSGRPRWATSLSAGCLVWSPTLHGLLFSFLSL